MREGQEEGLYRVLLLCTPSQCRDWWRQHRPSVVIGGDNTVPHPRSEIAQGIPFQRIRNVFPSSMRPAYKKKLTSLPPGCTVFKDGKIERKTTIFPPRVSHKNPYAHGSRTRLRLAAFFFPASKVVNSQLNKNKRYIYIYTPYVCIQQFILSKRHGYGQPTMRRHR